MKSSERPHCKQCHCVQIVLPRFSPDSGVLSSGFAGMLPARSSAVAGRQQSGARTCGVGWAPLSFPAPSHTGPVQCKKGVQEAVLRHRVGPKDPHCVLWSLALVSHKWLPIIPAHRCRCFLLTRGASGHFCRWLLSPACARLPRPAVLREE